MMRTKKTLLMALCLIVSTMAMQAQSTSAKKARIDEIRKMYAEAKDKPAFDMQITVNDVVSRETDGPSKRELNYYFYNERQIAGEGDFFEMPVCYFVTEKWSAFGQQLYRELLFNTADGKLAFAYNHVKTPQGVVTDSRFYYNDGQLIEQIHKSGKNGQLKDIAPDDEDNIYTDSDNELQMAEELRSVFYYLTYADGGEDDDAQHQLKVTPKDQRMKQIREAYPKALKKTERSAKIKTPRDIKVVIHDQDEGDCPPTTKEINYWFENMTDPNSGDNICDFITQHYFFMGFDSQKQFLINPINNRLMFAYEVCKEQNEKMEWRYYFDENEKCIEVKKTNTEDEGEENYYKQTVKLYIKAFNILLNN